MILVTGATGNAGGGVVNGLLELGADVRGLVRPGSEGKLPDGVEAAPADLNDPEALRAPLEGVSAVFLLSGYEGIERALELMRAAGVERVALLSSSAAPTGDLDNAVARYHILSERAVRESGLPWTFLQPNSFMSNAFRWLPQLERGDVIRGPFGDVAIATIDPDDLGAVAARALTSGEHEGQTYRLSGPEALRPGEQVAIMAKYTGRDLRFDPQDDDEARTEMEGQMPKEYVDAFFEFFREGTVDETTVQPTVEQVTGREPRSFADWAEAHTDAFR
ncbi:MAG: NAD(P)H-binding protein [Solirubrobacterales bacterium]